MKRYLVCVMVIVSSLAATHIQWGMERKKPHSLTIKISPQCSTANPHPQLHPLVRSYAFLNFEFPESAEKPVQPSIISIKPKMRQDKSRRPPPIQTDQRQMATAPLTLHSAPECTRKITQEEFFMSA